MGSKKHKKHKRERHEGEERMKIYAILFGPDTLISYLGSRSVTVVYYSEHVVLNFSSLLLFISSVDSYRVKLLLIVIHSQSLE